MPRIASEAPANVASSAASPDAIAFGKSTASEGTWPIMPGPRAPRRTRTIAAARTVSSVSHALTVAIADAPPFGARPNALPFHIDAATVGDFSIAAPYTGEAAVLPVAASSTGIDALPPAPAPSGPEAWTLAPPDVRGDDTTAFPAPGGHITAWLT